VAQTLIKLYPTPQNGNVGQNFLYIAPAPTNGTKWDLRGDANLTTKDNFFWRFSEQNQSVPASLTLPPPAYGGGSLDQTTQGISTGGTWNHIWKANLIMSIRTGWNYGFFDRDNPAQTGGALLNRQYGIKGGTDTITGGFSQMNITGYTALGIGPNNPWRATRKTGNSLGIWCGLTARTPSSSAPACWANGREAAIRPNKRSKSSNKAPLQ